MSKLWGSRFKTATNTLADQFTFSISYDFRLAKYDVQGSIAHARMLGNCGIIPQKDARAIVGGLKKILMKIEQGKWKFDPDSEDVHSCIQNELKAMIGAAADRLHTARSRNDQVVLDMKMYCIDEMHAIIGHVGLLQKSIVNFAKANADTVIPAYTHLQSAQVVLLAHHMLAYVEMLERDRSRFEDCLVRTDSMPLGSCALSGSSLSTDRKSVAAELGFSVVSANSMDAVSDRDFIGELIADIALLAMHLSRICEDLIVWATQEFNYIDIDWSMCTGSSIMPHKKNPDVLELLRGSSSQFPAAFVEIMTMLKALPLTYNRDMQLDKPVLFRSVDKIKSMLELLGVLFAHLKIKKSVIDKRLDADESFYSVDVMEYLIKKGESYRQAHDTVGKMVKECLDAGELISALPLSRLKMYSKHFDTDVKKLFNPQMSVRIKKSFGSTNPELVRTQLNLWEKKLKG